jgi:leader peptidase (prepilin peptidase)/N-methyltransferase
MIEIIILMAGLIVGSFLNVVIARMDELETIVNTRSHCPKCKKVLNWYDMVPLLSFMLLRRKCRNCKEKISWQYPIVELLTGLAFVGVYYFIGLNAPEGWLIPVSIVYMLLAACLIVIFFYDLLHYLIPEEIVWPAVALVVIFTIVYSFNGSNEGWAGLEKMVLGGVIGAGVPAILAVPSKGKWMGYGDISLGGLLGLILGYPMVVLGLFLAFVSGGIIGAGLIFAKVKEYKSAVPFGPFLIAGTFAALFWGEKIIDWYLGTIGVR